MAATDQQYSCSPLDIRSAGIFTSGDHAIIGLSPGNGYFTARRITELAGWAKSHFASMTFVALGEPFMGNLMAEGYSIEQAEISSARRERSLLNRARRALQAHEVSGTTSGVANWSDLCAIPSYRDSLALVKETFRTSVEFASAITQLTTEYLSTKQMVGDMPMTQRVEMATGYYLAELPLWLDAPRIFGQPTSSFCYQSASRFIERLWSGEFPISPAKTQGYLSITRA
jgi:cyclo(L-tyrosyl-L-tyrosyl) synthase